MSPLISVIVPAYNAEETIEKCIISIRRQSFHNIEIIIVNDGSKDLTGEICRGFCKADNRIRTEEQPNKGVVRARQKGIEKARGTYVSFVDSDDWIDEDCFEIMLEKIGDADILACGLFKEANGVITELINDICPGTYNGDDINTKIIPKMLFSKMPFSFGITPFFWNKLYKMDILKKVYSKIPASVYDGEDVVANCLYYT